MFASLLDLASAANISLLSYSRGTSPHRTGDFLNTYLAVLNSECCGKCQRIDGRECYDYRQMKISFGVDRGCCHVELGKTRVMCQVSCDVTSPKQARPSEGVLFVNVELSPMAAPHFEPGRQSDYGVEITRILERCIKESRCVDTESLCIMAGIKVWTVRVDVHVLNHDGGIIDAASTAAIAALAHFRRPDVTVSGEEVTIHTLEDRDPVPLSVHHMPICVTFAFYEKGKYLLVDPSEKEEKVMDGKMVIGMNKHREICTLHMAGSMLLLKDQVLKCSNIAVVKVTEITDLIQQALENDSKARSSGDKFGFAVSVDTQKVTANQTELQSVEMLSEDSSSSVCEVISDMEDVSIESKVISKTANTITIGEGGPNSWTVDDELEMESEIRAEKQQLPGSVTKSKRNLPKEQEVYELSGDSEEEDIVVLRGDQVLAGKSKDQQVSEEMIDLTKALKSTAKKGRKHKLK